MTRLTNSRGRKGNTPVKICTDSFGIEKDLMNINSPCFIDSHDMENR